MPARRLDQITDPDAVRRACAEFDEIGQEQFLTKYGFGRARSYELIVEGRRYDSKAILGAAYAYQHHGEEALGAQEFSGGLASTVSRLRALGFSVGTSAIGDRSYWALGADPKRYRIEDAVRELDIETWNTESELTPGDRVALWKFKGSGAQRGIVGLAEVTRKAVTSLDTSSFWVSDEVGSTPTPRVSLRLALLPDGPLWIDDVPELAEWSIARASGGTTFRVSDEQWELLMRRIGGWPPDSARCWHINETGVLAPLFAEGWLPIGFQEYLGSPDAPPLPETLDGFRTLFSDRSLGHAATDSRRAGEAFAFAHTMKPGDLVSYRTGPDLLQIGRVVGGLEAAPAGSPATYLRAVRWLVTVDRGLLGTGAREEMARRQTTFELSMDTSAELRVLSDPWTPLVAWIDAIISHPEFHEWEIDYRQKLSARLAAARDAVIAGGPAMPGLRSAFALPYNFTRYTTHQPFLKWCESEPESATDALRGLWDGSGSTQDRVGHFVAALPESVVGGPGPRTTLASYLLLATGVTDHPIYRTEAFNWAFKRLGVDNPGALPGERYAAAVALVDRIIQEGRVRGLDFPDRTHVQGALWTMFRQEPDAFSERVLAALGKFHAGHNVGPDHAVSVVSRVGGLAERLLVDESWLEGVLGLLELKRQVVFFGPPGTGKTYVAREIAKLLAGEEGSVEFVQFHPAYSYEDFAQGYRPVELSSGQPGFRLSDGPLLRLAKRAREAPEATHVLVIDELNRGNVAKIFGELFFLLEYRDAEVTLAYQPPDGEAFSLPANIRVIATMNTADRSIALIDQALRRRFFFVGFHPDEHPVKGLLARWLERERPELDWIARLVDEANALLGEDARATGIGPSHFMLSDSNQLNEALVQQIWTHSILPTLEEHFYGQPDRLTDFNYHTLRNTKLAELADTSHLPEGEATDAA